MTILVDGELLLFGAVGDSFWEIGFTARDVAEALAELGRSADVTVRINSGGGNAFEGTAIFNALSAHRGAVTVIVEAIAASAASIIAMAGDTITMRKGAVMMIHDPSSITIGTAADHEKSVEMLEAVAASMADIYAERSGKSADECREEMVAETWMTADEAVEDGYADGVDDGAAGEPTAFNYRAYQHAPERIAALADAKGWSKPPAGAPQQRKKPMTRQTPAAATAAAPAAAEENSGGIVSGLIGLLATVLGRSPAQGEMAGEDARPPRNAPAAPATAAATAPVALTPAETAEIVTLAATSGAPAMAAALIVEQGMTLARAKERIASAKEIRDVVAMARRRCPAIAENAADAYIAAATPIAQVKADLLDKTFKAQSPEIQGQHQAATSPAAADPAAAAASWKDVVAKVNAENKVGRKNAA